MTSTDFAPALADIRAGFEISPDKVYLDGNSLGPLHRHVREKTLSVLQDEWGDDLIAGWNKHDWINLPLTVGNQVARLVGANPGEVLCCDNLSINLFKALAAALQLNTPRTRIVTEATHFPTDNYIAEGLAQLLGPGTCRVDALPLAEIEKLDFSDVAVLSLAHVDFRTGHRRNLPALTQRAQSGGALILWDLAHSAGVIDTALRDNNVDLAVGCTYKFLNGGPGSPGFLYVAQRHQHAGNVIPGWMGHADRFAFEASYRPAQGIGRFLTGTQSVIALAAAGAALSVFDDIDIGSLRECSLRLSDAFLAALGDHPTTAGIQCLTPTPHSDRGSQISLRLPEGYPISQALIERGVIVDFREPDIVRFGFAPLYNQPTDIDQAVAALADILDTRCYEASRFNQRNTVT